MGLLLVLPTETSRCLRWAAATSAFASRYFPYIIGHLIWLRSVIITITS
jgi:hypothetical protein